MAEFSELLLSYAGTTNGIQKVEDIPENKKRNITNKVSNLGISSVSVFAFIDTTLFKSCKEGIGFTSDSLIFIDTFASKAESYLYTDLIGAEIGYNKKKEVDSLTIEFTNKKINIANVWVDVLGLKRLIEDIIEYKNKNTFERSTVIILSDQPSKVKLKYFESIVNILEDISDSEVALLKLYSIMLLLKFGSEERVEARKYLTKKANTDKKTDVNEIIADLEQVSIENGLTSLEVKIIKMSLLKDIITLYIITSDTKSETDLNNGVENPVITIDRIKAVATSIKNLYSDSEENMIKNLISIELLNIKIIDGDIDDDEFKKAITESSAKLAAVGVPLVALYFSGSVVGFSAAGITSALSFLGLGGILGLSSMVTGIGVVILAGVVTYKAFSWLTNGMGEEKKRIFRDKLLMDALKNNQQTAVLLVEDTVELVSNFVKLQESQEKNKEMAKRLMAELIIYKKVVQVSADESKRLDSYLQEEKKDKKDKEDKEEK